MECRHGASAVKQKLADHKNLDVTIVWSPMMESDNEAAARDAERMLKGTRVTHYYDPGRRVGLAFRRDVFPDAFEHAMASLPADHWLKHEFAVRGPDYSGQPEWDIYMFFDRGVKWAATPPRPFHFIRHMGRIGENGESLMWIDDYAKPPVEGDLIREVGRVYQEVTR